MRAVVVVVIAAAAMIAHADPDPAAVERAKVHFKQAKAYQDARDYARAADEYKAAYELDPRPEMLFNVGQAFRLAGAKREALDYFKRYLDEQPDGPGSDEARRHVARLTEETDERLGHRIEPVEPVKPREVVTAPVETPVPIAPTPSTGARDGVDRPRSTLKLVGIATAGVGIIVIGLGAKFGIDARNASDQITHHTGAWTAADQTTFENGQAANRNMVISFVAGGVLAITGAVIYRFAARPVRAGIAATASGASVVVAGTLW
jgi:tetratricopeptide (TPR) repeat protein